MSFGKMQSAVLPLLRPSVHKVLKIGGRRLVLDIRQPHECEYHKQWTPIDVTIGRAFLRAGDVVLDCGANIGFTALHYLAVGASVVYACEPEPRLYRRLARLAGSRVHTFQVALADEDGYADLFLSLSHNQGHTLASRFLGMWPAVYGKTPRTVCVRQVRVDTLFPAVAFDFVKIDVEGSELGLLRGARKLLTERTPRLLQVEAYADTCGAVHAELSSHYPYSHRGAIRLEDGGLAVLPHDGTASALPPGLREEAPVYLYSLEPLEAPLAKTSGNR